MDIHLSSSIPLTHSKLMIGCVRLRGNLRLHNVMIKRRFCMLLDSYKGLHLTDFFRFGRTEANPITWPEFHSAFRSHHVLLG